MCLFALHDAKLSCLGVWAQSWVCALNRSLSYPGTVDAVSESCPTLGDPVDYSLAGSSVHGISQAIVLEWVALSSSRGSS